jgi:hypothetical protein
MIKWHGGAAALLVTKAKMMRRLENGAKRCHRSVQNLVDRPEILVQPVQRLLGQIVDRNKMTGVIKEQFLLAFPGAEPMKERLLT